MGKFLSGIRESKRDEKERRFQAKGAGYKGPLIIAEGDSWFEYPWQDDIIWVLSNTYKIKPLARAGDTWNDILTKNELDPAVDALNPDIVLLSIGGNDLVDPLPLFVRQFSPALERTGKAYVIKSVFRSALELVVGHYDRTCRRIVDKGIDVIVSGYDYPNPRIQEDGGQWIGPVLRRARNLFDIPVWHEITRELIDTYDRRMRTFEAAFNSRTDPAASLAKLTFVSQIDAVNAGSYAPHPGSLNPRWNDEMHAKNEGFARLAGRVGGAIDQVWQRRQTPIV